MNGILMRGAVPADLEAIVAIQTVTFPDFQEERAVFAQRIALYPEGFLVVGRGENVEGYVVSHPARRAKPPHLNTLGGFLPDDPDVYYIHDLSLLPGIRGTGASALLISALKVHAAESGFTRMMLTAVGGSSVFWARHGFVAVPAPALVERLAGYGPQAVYMEHLLV